MEREDLDQDPLGLQAADCRAGRKQAAIFPSFTSKHGAFAAAQTDEKQFAQNGFLIDF